MYFFPPVLSLKILPASINSTAVLLVILPCNVFELLYAQNKCTHHPLILLTEIRGLKKIKETQDLTPWLIYKRQSDAVFLVVSYENKGHL